MTMRFAPNSMSLPPPATDLELFDGARLVGWVRGRAVGFRGFASESEAASAAWVAHTTLARRLARRNGGATPPVEVEPLSLLPDGERALILAGDRPIATLVPPSADSLSGPDSFGFEIQVPVPAGELFMRSLAYGVYRTLRKSGARWARWDGRRVNPRRVAANWLAMRRSRAAEPGRATKGQTGRSLRRVHPRRGDRSEESMRSTGWLALGGVSIAVLLSAFFAPEQLAVALAAIGFVGLILFRLTAGWAGWAPARGARPKVRAGRSDDGASGPRLQLSPQASRNGTSPWRMSS